MSKLIIIEDGLNLYNKTGQGQYSQNLYTVLAQMGYNVEMKRKPFLEKIRNSTIKRILYILWVNLIFPLQMMLKNTDTIIFTNTLSPFFKLPNKKYYPVLHDLWAYKSPETVTFVQWLYTKVVIASIRHTYKKIITVSETAKNEIVDFFKCSADDVHVIYNTFSFGENPKIDYSDEQQACLLKKYNIESKKYILSVATLNKRKNIPMLIDAYNQINTGVKLVLVGKTSSEQFNCLNSNVVFTGYISDEELKVLYKHSLIYAFPSVYEGFGIPIIDAQAFGIPVICSDIPIFKEIGDMSVEYCTIKVGSIQEKLNDLLNNHIHQQEFIKRGYENIKRFDTNIIKQQVLEILNNEN